MEHVHLCLLPNTDDKCRYQHPKVSHSFFHFEPLQHPVGTELLKLAREMNIESEILSIAPILEYANYFYPSVLEEVFELQETLFSSPRWHDVREGIPEEAEPVKQVGTFLYILQKLTLWAKETTNYPADVVYCTDFDTLIAGVVHKKKYGSRLIYDIADIFYNEYPGLFNSMYRALSAMVEYIFSPYADIITGAGKRELEILQQHYFLKQPMYFIPNCSTDSEAFHSKEWRQPIRFFYQGIADKLRGVEALIDAIALVPQAQLHLRCLPSVYLDQIKDQVLQRKLEYRVFFLDAVEPDQVTAAAAASGDVGVSIIAMPHRDTSYYIKTAMTTKYIDYLKSGMPVLTLEEMEQGEITERYGCGVTIGGYSPEEIAKGMRYFLEHPEQYQEMSQNALRAHRELFDWAIYKPLWENIICGPLEIKLNYLDEEQLWMRQESVVWQKLFLKELRASLSENPYREKLGLQETVALRQSTNVLKMDIAQLYNENAYLQQQCNIIEYSRSWKITEPLRWLKRFLVSAF